MSAELAVREPTNRRPGPAAYWQFNIARARPLLRRKNAWDRDTLERFLAEVRIVEVSDAALQLFALPMDRARALARPIGSLWPEDGLAALSDLLASIASDGGDLPLTRGIGRMDRWTDVILTGWRSGDPRCPDIIFVSIQAAPDAPGALRELEASRHRHRSLISSLPLPVWEVDVRAARRMFDQLRDEGVVDLDEHLRRHPELVQEAYETVVVTDANQDAVDLLGANSPSALLGPVGYMFESAETVHRIMVARYGGQRNYVEPMKVRRFDGQSLDVLLLVTFPSAGEWLDTIIMIDNTAQLEAETRLRQIEADFTHAARLSTLGQMTASIAHEIKQPLSAILTNAETSLRWLAKADPNLPKVIQLSERIAASAQRATDIIARIQDMAGKRRPQQSRLDLNDVIREALTFVRHDNEERGVRLTLEMATDLPAVAGDRVQLQQVVVNLLVNSAQALAAVAPDAREIQVSTFRADGDNVAFRIRDSGPGIPASDLDLIFGGFFSTKEGGMGIGLTICQTIIAAHGGTIAAGNCPYGNGAEFRVSLPAERAALLNPAAR